MANTNALKHALVPHRSRLLLRICLIVIGSIVSAYGITLAIHAGFGKATLAVLWEGVSNFFGITLGTASFVIAIAMIAFAFAFDRKQIAFGTLLYQLIYSPCIDAFAHAHVYFGMLVPDFMLMVLGVALFAIGTGIYAAADSGRGSYEALNFTISHLTERSIRSVRMALDAGVVMLGVMLGGTFGACTICTILISGPIIQKSIEATKQILKLDLQQSD